MYRCRFADSCCYHVVAVTTTLLPLTPHCCWCWYYQTHHGYQIFVIFCHTLTHADWLLSINLSRGAVWPANHPVTCQSIIHDVISLHHRTTVQSPSRNEYIYVMTLTNHLTTITFTYWRHYDTHMAPPTLTILDSCCRLVVTVWFTLHTGDLVTC